jgi:hypothetical protein
MCLALLTSFAQRKGSAAETKPFTNFSVFHDNLITRLKAVSQIQLDFDKQVKETETRFSDKLTYVYTLENLHPTSELFYNSEFKKQLDGRWKQIDRFETSVKNLTDVRNTWRRKYNVKEGELEAAKVSVERGGSCIVTEHAL